MMRSAWLRKAPRKLFAGSRALPWRSRGRTSGLVVSPLLLRWLWSRTANGPSKLIDKGRSSGSCCVGSSTDGKLTGRKNVFQSAASPLVEFSEVLHQACNCSAGSASANTLPITPFPQPARSRAPTHSGALSLQLCSTANSAAASAAVALGSTMVPTKKAPGSTGSWLNSFPCATVREMRSIAVLASTNCRKPGIAVA